MRILTIALLLLLSPLCRAAGGLNLPFYATGFLDRQSISLSDARFEPLLAGVAVGAWLYEGIALEAELGTGVGEDDAGILSLETESQLSLGVRLESEPLSGVAAYAVLGVSGVSINSRFTAGIANTDSFQFRGFRGMFGLTFSPVPRWVIDAAFSRSEYDDDFGISSFRIGVRYALNGIRPRERRGWYE
jgi:hypothetical protein